MVGPPPSLVAIRAAQVIDAVVPEPIANGVVVVEGGSITAVGTADQVSVPRHARRIDLGDRTLLPGLMDVHIHLSGWRSYGVEAPTIPRDLLVLRAAEDCHKLLQAGFTTVRDVGGMIALSLKRAIAEGTLVGPRIYAAESLISQTGGHGDTHWLPLEEARKIPDMLIADGPDQCRQAVRQAIRAGADLIKICTTGGVASERDHPEDTHFTFEEIATMVDEAHRARRRVASHAQGKQGVLNAVRAGVDTIEHGFYLDEECATEMRDRGVHYIPTFGLIEGFKQSIDNPLDIPEWQLRKQHEVIAAMERSFLLAYTSGLPLATGTDYFGHHGMLTAITPMTQ